VAVDISSLGPLGDPIGGDNGESEGVFPLVRKPAQLFKKYKPHCATPEDANRLDWLIERASLASAADRAMLKEKCSWPLERVIDGTRPAAGVLLPRAPAKFQTTILLSGDNTKTIQLEVDWLASAPEKCERRRIPVPTFEERLRICMDIVEVADFLDRHDIVYGDWSYANAFWSPDDHSGYVIDVDGSGYRKRKPVATQNWDDPRLGTGRQADGLTDRYGVALLLARCLTGIRDIEPALTRLREIAPQHDATALATLVENGLSAHVREERPRVGTLLTALRHVRAGTPTTKSTSESKRPDSGVIAWRSVRFPIPATASHTSPKSERPVPPPTTSRPQPVRAPTPRPTRTSDAVVWFVIAVVAVLIVLALIFS
jgi:hypothetical protein